MPRSRFGSIVRLDTDYYQVFWSDNGKRYSKRIRGEREEAEAFLAARQLSRGGMSDMKWGTYWKIAVVPTFDGLAAKTVHEYDRVWRVELEPRIGEAMVGNTTWRQVETVLNDIKATSVQMKALRLWRKICNMAVRDELLDRNPVDRSIKIARHTKKPKPMLSREDVLPFLETIRGLKCEPVLLMELGGGLRHEEACAMVWEKVERWEDGRTYVVLTVDRAIVEVNGRKVLKGTKNDSSVREAVIGEPFASRILELHRGNGPVSASKMLPRGDKYDECHFAIPTAVTNNWRRWCERNGAAYVNPGALRSIYATLHGEAGTLDSLVSLSMGHSDGTTRGRNYQQATRKGLQIVADSLTDYLAK